MFWFVCDYLIINKMLMFFYDKMNWKRIWHRDLTQEWALFILHDGVEMRFATSAKPRTHQNFPLHFFRPRLRVICHIPSLFNHIVVCIIITTTDMQCFCIPFESNSYPLSNTVFEDKWLLGFWNMLPFLFSHFKWKWVSILPNDPPTVTKVGISR